MNSTFALCESSDVTSIPSNSNTTNQTDNNNKLNYNRDMASQVSPAQVVGWGMRFANHPKSIDFFQNTKLSTLKFSAILQCALDIDGIVYFRYNKVTFKKQ